MSILAGQATMAVRATSRDSSWTGDVRHPAAAAAALVDVFEHDAVDDPRIAEAAAHGGLIICVERSARWALRLGVLEVLVPKKQIADERAEVPARDSSFLAFGFAARAWWVRNARQMR